MRANVVSGQPLTVPLSGHLDVASGTGIQYLNPTAFASPPTSPVASILSLGNSPRYFSNLKGPFQPSENFGLFKRFISARGDLSRSVAMHSTLSIAAGWPTRIQHR